MTSNLKTGKSK